MDLDTDITLTTPQGPVKLPLKNFLRLTIVYLNKMLPEFYEDPEHKSNSINEFWIWMQKKLGTEGKHVLL